MASNFCCWHCGSELIWGADFDFEDYGFDHEGIVSTFSCSNKKCPTTADVYYDITQEKEILDESEGKT